jgi:hypothetical protein
VSIDDRIRIASEAFGATVREVHPLVLPDAPAPAPRAARTRPHWTRVSRGWLIPLAAALAVIAVAATLVAVRGLSAPAGTPAVPGHTAGLPRYGVVLTKTTAKIPHKWGSGTVEISNLSVVDTRTGRQVALVKHPVDVGFMAVTAAADDRTFAVTANYFVPTPLPGVKGDMEDIRVFYLLRIDPGSARPATLTRLGITAQPSAAFVDGFALSPDGRTLAVLEWGREPYQVDKGTPATLTLYSVATGKALRTWTGGLGPAAPRYGDSFLFSENYAGLTWLPDARTLAFTYYASGQAPAIRTLDTTRQGDDLVAGSKRVFTLPTGGPGVCTEAMLTSDGKTVVCGTQSSSDNLGCGPVNHGILATTGTLEIDTYSTATGERERVLFRHTGECNRDGMGALGWIGPGNTVVVMANLGGSFVSASPVDYTRTTIGVLKGGKFVPLKLPALPFDQGPGTIAF